MKSAVKYIKKNIEQDSDTFFNGIHWEKFDEIIKQALKIEKDGRKKYKKLLKRERN